MSDPERVAKLEGVVEGLRTVHTVTFSVLALLVALVVGFGLYSLKRMDDLSEKVSGLPTQITNSLRDLTTTLSTAITAAKQQPPQVILIPAPTPAPPPQEVPR